MSTPFSTEYPRLAGTWEGITPGTGVATALAVNTGSAGAFVVQGGALGTPSSGTLTSCTGLPIAGLTASTSTALGVGSIELGHASDTTLARSGAGDMTIEGNQVYRAGGTDVAVADGGTGASTASTARSNLGLGTAATANTGTSGTVLGLLDGANLYSGSMDVSQSFRARGSAVQASGFGVEIGTSGTIGSVQSYDRSAAAYRELRHIGLSNTFYASATLILTVAATVITAAKPVQFPSYTVATVPAASLGAGSTIYVSDESGGAVLAFSDATNWRRVTDRAVIS